MMAFNNSIKTEWEGMKIPGLSVYSTFGFGKSVLIQNGINAKLDDKKSERILETLNPRLNNKQVWPIVRLTELARLTLTENDYEQLSYLAADNCLQINEQGLDHVQDLLEKHVEVLDVIDFADMVWLPHMLGKRVRPFDFLGIDECQDLNKAQHSLITNHANRFLMVGDERQAIYQFAGADEKSYENLKAYLETRPIGMMELPLTISRRCSKAATRLAREIVPAFRCLDTASEGSVTEQEEDRWLSRDIGTLTPDHMVIARRNAPVVRATLELLRRRKPAKMLGRSFGKDVIFHMGNVAKGHEDTDAIRQLVMTDLQKKTFQWSQQKYISERMVENYCDIATSSIVFCELCKTKTEIVHMIDQMFADAKENPKNVIRLSSVHRAKGLEARHIHFLEHDITGLPRMIKKQLVQPKPEEVNLRYIGITRTQEHLTLVKAVQQQEAD
jgi:superfamily I DNA/RNA helicase